MAAAVQDDVQAISRQHSAHCHQLRILHNIRFRNGNPSQFSQGYETSFSAEQSSGYSAGQREYTETEEYTEEYTEERRRRSKGSGGKSEHGGVAEQYGAKSAGHSVAISLVRAEEVPSGQVPSDGQMSAAFRNPSSDLEIGRATRESSSAVVSSAKPSDSDTTYDAGATPSGFSSRIGPTSTAMFHDDKGAATAWSWWRDLLLLLCVIAIIYLLFFYTNECCATSSSSSSGGAIVGIAEEEEGVYNFIC